MEQLTLPLPICAWPECNRVHLHTRGLCFRCYQRARKAGTLDQFTDPRKVDRRCVTCTKPIPESTHPSAVTCSRSCNHRRWREANQEKVKADKLRWYRENSEVVIARAVAHYAANQERRRAQVAAWNVANPERRRAHNSANNARRRALEAAAFVEHIDIALVWTRDEGRCWLCEVPVDPLLKWPDPMSGSIDHVRPLSKGGVHAMSNVALTHLGCNSSKQDKLVGRVPRWMSAA